jgi:hypothetical protein
MVARTPDNPYGLEPVEPSPLDRPLNATYLGVLVLEAAIVVLLVVFGKIFS